MSGLDLPLIWAGIIAGAVLLYVLLDGFDLGVGILFPFAGSPAARDVMMDTIAPACGASPSSSACAAVAAARPSGPPPSPAAPSSPRSPRAACWAASSRGSR
jgi:hypothetical protein